MPEIVKKKESIFKSLTRLLRSGPVVRHKISAGENSYEPRGTASAYKKELSSLYVHSLASYGQHERLARYADYAEMEYCLSGDTLIAVPNGFKTIKALSEEYGLDKQFIVYSYDHEKGIIVPAFGRQARKTRTDHAWKVTFDDGRSIIGTADHRLMLRDGSYRTIGDLSSGDSMMPFYRRSLFSENRRDPDDYQWIYNGKKWITEHRMIAEWANDRLLNNNEVVHHINFKRSDNRPENLAIMDKTEHQAYHARLNNEKKWNDSNKDWIEKFRKNHSQFMKQNNPSARKDITFAIILQVAEGNDFNLVETSRRLDVDYLTIQRRLEENRFVNWSAFARAYDPNWRNHGWNNAGMKNPRYDRDLTFQRICDGFVSGMKPRDLALKLCTTQAKIKKRVADYGFKSVKDFCDSYENAKVVSIEYVGIIDLYDLTVDGYKNFATDTVISHNTPEIAAALNIYADEATSFDEKGAVIDIISKNGAIKAHLETLFFDVLNIEFNMWSWARNLCKTGDFMMFVDASEQNGILNLLPIPINEIEREEGFDKNDPFAVRFRWLAQGNKVLENWQVIHFRLLGNDGFLPYGTSMIEPARRIWRQLILIEDAMLVYRIVRSPERRVYYIDVGAIPPESVDTFMEKIKTQLKRTQIVDPNTGRVDLRYNPLSVDEDYFIPVRGEKSSRIETLAGGQFTGDIEDVQYIQNKLISALMVPKAYLGYEGDIGSKATLAQQDVRFARTIERIQRIMIAELNKIAIIHLFLLGYRGEDLVDFTIEMANPSTIAEQQKLELWRARFEIAQQAGEGILDTETIYSDIFNFPEDKIDKIRQGKIFDKLEQLRLESLQLPEEDTAGQSGQSLPGEDSLPDTLGGTPGGDEGSQETDPSNPPGGAETQPEGVEDEGDLVLASKRNPGSEGDQAEKSVTKGKNLFSTGEDQHALAFGTEKQTLSDPGDLRSIRRIVTRPFSERVKSARGRLVENDVYDEMVSQPAAIEEELKVICSSIEQLKKRR